MRKITKLAWPRLAVVAMLAAPASAAAGAGQAAAVAVSAPALAGRAPTAYVTIAGDGLRPSGHVVVPINTATNKPGQPIKVGKLPAAIAITPNGKTAYVVNEGDSGYSDATVTPITTATNKPGPPIRVGVLPGAIAITPNGKTAYVTNLISDTVTPISTATNRPGKQIQVGVRPQAMVVTPDSKTVYVDNQDGTAVTPIPTATNRPGKPIKVGGGPLAIAITPDGKSVYVANTGTLDTGDTVTPISTATNKPGKPVRLRSFPFVMAITPDGKTLYVTTGRNEVTPIATATNTAGKPIKVGLGPDAIAITPNGKTVYVTSSVSDSVMPINVATDTPGKPISTGREPLHIAITPDGRTAYVTNARSDTVTPINTATNTAGKPIKVGNGPSAIAITPAVAPAGAPAMAGPAGLPVLTATRPAPVTPPAPGAVTSAILLINGDRLVTRCDGTGTHVAGILPGAASGLAGTMVALVLGGVRYEVPEVALPYLGRGLNPDLFRLGSLAARESGGRLPVTVSYHGRPPTLAGVTITHTGRGAAGGYLTAAGARTFGQALARQFTADHARGSYGQDGMFGGGVAIGLAGAPARAAAPAVRSPMHTLTITGTSLAGRPDTGDTVLVMNADNGRIFADPIESQQVFVHGTAKFSVPAGHYWALGFFSSLYPGVFLPVLPQFSVFRNTTVHMDGRSADSKLQMVTPRPALQHMASLILIHPTPAGPAEGMQIFTSENPIPIYASPTTRRPTTGTLQVFPFEQLVSEAPGTPYLYELAYRNTSGLIPRLRYVVTPASLATVDARYYSSAKVFGNYFEDPIFPRQGIQVANDLFSEGALEVGLPAPRHLTEYLTGGPGLQWTSFYFLLNPGSLGGQFDGWRALPAGQRVTQTWNAYPLHEGYNDDLVGTANPSPWVPSASREGDKLTLDISPFSDSVPGHTGVGGAPFTGGSYQIDENGKQIAAGDPGTQRGFNGEFDTHVALSPHPGVVRVALSVALTGRAAPKLSPADQTVWTWRSAHEAGATLPAGWTCLPTGRGIAHPVRSCAAEPMMTLGYGVTGLGLNGSAPSGPQVLHLTVGHIQLAKAAAVTKASVSVSFDGGKTWHPAQVSGHAGHYTAVFTAQAGALVTLRTHATDAAGGSVTETITSAYQVAS
jgi:YVTN family beta-propeller protein